MGPRSSGTPAPAMPRQQGKRPVGSGHISTTLAARARPTSSSRDQLLPLLPALAPLFPRGGLQRGGVVTVGIGEGTPAPRAAARHRGACAGGGTTLGFALLAAASTASWCAAVGTADPGIVACRRARGGPRAPRARPPARAPVGRGGGHPLRRHGRRAGPPARAGAPGGGPAAGRPGPRAPGGAGGAGGPGRGPREPTSS